MCKCSVPFYVYFTSCYVTLVIEADLVQGMWCDVLGVYMYNHDAAHIVSPETETSRTLRYVHIRKGS